MYNIRSPIRVNTQDRSVLARATDMPRLLCLAHEQRRVVLGGSFSGYRQTHRSRFSVRAHQIPYRYRSKQRNPFPPDPLPINSLNPVEKIEFSTKNGYLHRKCSFGLVFLPVYLPYIASEQLKRSLTLPILFPVGSTYSR